VAEGEQNHYILATIGFNTSKFNYYSRNIGMNLARSGLHTIYWFSEANRRPVEICMDTYARIIVRKERVDEGYKKKQRT
jgi:hypothetical protein